MTSETGDVERMTIIAWSGELDRVWPTLILSSTGAAYGMQVTIFFTFWGLFTLIRDDVRLTGDHPFNRGLSMLNRPGLGRMKLSKLNMGGMGALLMRKLAEEKKVASPDELLQVCRDLDVRLWPCQMTMDMLGLRREDMVEGVGEPVGAATALAEMQRSSVHLFI